MSLNKLRDEQKQMFNAKASPSPTYFNMTQQEK